MLVGDQLVRQSHQIIIGGGVNLLESLLQPPALQQPMDEIAGQAELPAVLQVGVVIFRFSLEIEQQTAPGLPPPVASVVLTGRQLLADPTGDHRPFDGGGLLGQGLPTTHTSPVSSGKDSYATIS